MSRVTLSQLTSRWWLAVRAVQERLVITDQIYKDSNYIMIQFPNVHDGDLPAGLRFNSLTIALQELPVCYLFGGTLLSNQLICFAK